MPCVLLLLSVTRASVLFTKAHFLALVAQDYQRSPW